MRNHPGAVRAVLAALAVLTGLSLAPSTAVATPPPPPAPSTEIRPAALERGADPAVPHLRGRTVVDGDHRVPVPGSEPVLHGSTGDGYVVGYLSGDTYRLATLREDQPPVVLARRYGQEVVVADGGLVALTRSVSGRRTVVTVVVAGTGDVVGRRAFTSRPGVLDLSPGGVALVGGPGGLRRWDVPRDRVRRIGGRGAYAGDLGTDRLAFFTADPYQGGCTVVTTVSRPRAPLWRSCREAVAEFSPDGRRVLTVHKLTDGPGAGRVWERTVRGRRLADYTARGFISSIGWEDETHALLTAYGRTRGADVRCSAGDCERVSGLRPVPY